MRKAAAALLIFLIRVYQFAFSPLFRGCCRFSPTCSNYAVEAIMVHGAAKGALLAGWRILRCHPFGDYGYDPVPARGRWKNDFVKMERKDEQD